jgi:hypothetical protein
MSASSELLLERINQLENQLQNSQCSNRVQLEKELVDLRKKLSDQTQALTESTVLKG